MTAPLWLKIACVVTFIAVMVTINMGVRAFGEWAGPEVGIGFLLGSAVTLFFAWLYWPSAGGNAEPEQDF